MPFRQSAARNIRSMFDDDDRRARAGRAVRDLGHALIGHHTNGSLLDELAEALEAYTARLEVGARRSREPDSFHHGEHWQVPDDGGQFFSNDDRPVSGRSSPWGLDPVVRRAGDEVEAVVTLRAAHEGAPARSHGGVVAALFDDIYGFVLTIQQTSAFTGELAVRYERGTPLHVPLTCRVRMVRRDGRKMYMTGELIEPDGQVCVRSTATFIAIDVAVVPEWGDGV
jgi:acyl-coenzyme A thioesterase PaaI-like protein